MADTSQTSNYHYENPFYLHSNDHAGLLLVSDRLKNTSDFYFWKRSVVMALNVRNKLGFVDGTIPKPPVGDRNFGSWSRCNDLVTTWLITYVSKKIGQSLLFISTAERIWQNLMSRFKQANAPRIYDIEHKLSKIEQGALDVSAYYTKLVTLWKEHKNHVELPLCTCGKCECDAALKCEKLQERSRVTKFLMGLNESNEQTRCYILMLKPIPSIEEAFNIVAQYERQRSIKTTSKVENVVFQTVANENALSGNNYIATYNSGRPTQRPLCTQCGKMSHTMQKCYKLHGFPPWYKSGAVGNKNQFQPRGMMPQLQPRGMMPSQQFQQNQMGMTANQFQQPYLVANVHFDNNQN